MDREVFHQMAEYCADQQYQTRTIAYLSAHLRKFLRRDDRVMLCFLDQRPGSLSWLFAQALLELEITPITIEADKRWKYILRSAFTNRVSAIIGEPLLLLGLAKLKIQTATPLFIRRVITTGYPCPEWMRQGIVTGLDCAVGGCFALQQSGTVAGFACGHSWGVHIRDEEFGVEILDKEGKNLPPGKVGEILIYPKTRPDIRYAIGDNARLVMQPCDCGSRSPRLMDMRTGSNNPMELDSLGQGLQKWNSILDCRLKKSVHGLEIEIICFPGEKLPRLPTTAKQVIRPWQPEVDEPFEYRPGISLRENFTESH